MLLRVFFAQHLRGRGDAALVRAVFSVERELLGSIPPGVILGWNLFSVLICV